MLVSSTRYYVTTASRAAAVWPDLRSSLCFRAPLQDQARRELETERTRMQEEITKLRQENEELHRVHIINQAKVCFLPVRCVCPCLKDGRDTHDGRDTFPSPLSPLVISNLLPPPPPPPHPTLSVTAGAGAKEGH